MAGCMFRHMTISDTGHQREFVQSSRYCNLMYSVSKFTRRSSRVMNRDERMCKWPHATTSATPKRSESVDIAKVRLAYKTIHDQTIWRDTMIRQWLHCTNQHDTKALQ